MSTYLVISWAGDTKYVSAHAPFEQITPPPPLKAELKERDEEGSRMSTYLVISWAGDTKHISAYTSSEAYQKAVAFCGDDGIKVFEEV